MAGSSRYAKAVLALTAGFVLFCGGWYLARTSAPVPYQVNTAQRPAETEISAEEETPEEAGFPDSLLPGETIDLNTADVYDLQRLPGIGEKRANDIVAYREEHGPFQSVDELTEISGIGTGILEGLQEYASVG